MACARPGYNVCGTENAHVSDSVLPGAFFALTRIIPSSSIFSSCLRKRLWRYFNLVLGPLVFFFSGMPPERMRLLSFTWTGQLSCISRQVFLW